MIYTVEFVYSNEATPRTPYTRTVKAADAEDAKLQIVALAHLAGDRVETTGVYTDSRH